MENSNAVKVRAADWNGKSFDSYPFDHVPQWLLDAENNGKVKSDNIGSTDYLVWRVSTPSGEKIAEPGDWIVLVNNNLFVMDSNNYTMQFFT